MKSEKFIVLICTLYSVLCTPLWAQTSQLAIGVRGGGQTFLPTAAVGATGDMHATIEGTGSIDLRYTFYHCLTDRFGLGGTFSAGLGYGTTGIIRTNTDSYSSTDYLGNTMDYTVHSTYSLKDRFATADVSLLFAMCFGNVILHVGPRLMMPFAVTTTLTVEQVSIDAYYPLYDVHVTDQLITGKLETPYQHPATSSLPQYNLLMALELGYEWYLNGHNCLGIQAFADVAVWSPPTPNSLIPNPLIQVAPIRNANDPVPAVTVNAPSDIINRRYLDFGLRAYYAFSITHVSEHKKRPHSRDTRNHRNRYYW